MQKQEMAVYGGPESCGCDMKSWIGETEREIERSCRDAGVIGIENGVVIYSPDMALLEIKNKLSSLSGKHTIQTEQEIDDQINDLRDWER